MPEAAGGAGTGRGPAVVSGAGSGIGREIAIALAERGHPVALLGRTEATLRETREAIVGNPSTGRGVPADSAVDRENDGVLVLPCDVRDWQAVARAAAAVESGWGPAEVVVPAAGTVALAPTDELSAEAFAAMVEVNLNGAFHLVRAFLPAMKRRGRGRLVPILSVAATTGFPGWSGYCASKWGLAGLVAALRADLAGTGVLVSALYPGAVDTPLWDDLPGDWDRTKMVPPAEVARAVLYALDVAEPALVEEVRIGPAGGAL